jgi:hypothetical protein
VKLDVGNDSAGRAFASCRLIQPAGLDKGIGGHGLDMHRADDVIVRGVGAIVPKQVVPRDQLEVAEHTVAAGLVLEPRIVVAAAKIPEVVVSVDGLSLGHGFFPVSRGRRGG